MATTMVEIEGIFEWAKVFENNRDFKYSEETDGEYQISVVMDKANADKLRDAGCRRKITTDPEGRGFVVRLTRPHAGKNAWACGQPQVAGPDGTAWDIRENGLIGNGSSGRVLASVFTTTKGTGTRLEAIQVVDHVQFVSEGGDGDAPKGGVNSFFKDMTGSTPKQPVTPAPKAASSAPIPEDEIPF